MKNKKLSARIGCVLGSVSVAVFSVFTFALSPVSVHAETSELWDNELNAWLDLSMDYVLTNSSSISNSAAWYCSLQYMKYALNENPQMIHAGDKWSTLSPGYGYYYNDEGHLRGLMFPTDYDRSGRYSEMLICSGPDFTIYYTCETDNSDFSTYVYFNGWSGSSSYNYTHFVAQAVSNTPGNVTFTAKCTGNYFTSIENWQRTFTLTSTSSVGQSLYLECKSSIPTISRNYVPSFSGGYITCYLCGNYQEIDFTDLSISDIALTQLATPAQLHDYLVNDYCPAFETDNPGYSFTSVPSEPVETETTETGSGSGGCDCHVEVNVEVNPTLELPSEWNEDLVDLETQHYTAPYEDMVIEPWKDLQEQYTTEPLRKNALAKRVGEDSETDDYTFVAPLLDDNIISTIGDYELFCEQLFTASGIKTTVAIVLSAGFVIRFISLK